MSIEQGRWERAWEVFHTVAEAAAAEREALIQRLCGDDEELAAEVRSLVEMVAGPEDLLDRPGEVGLWGPGVEEGRRLGAYRVVRRLATGGMGEVFLGERADGEFEQQVAIKVVRPLLQGEEMERRFRQERQILAGLDHPAIARLLDGGTEGGSPYFVLELVDGEPIDSFCDGHGLGVEERLALFLRVCDAVSHAHRNLVIHRDLKPGNVLVTPDGEPKLLDFGIAKLLESEGGHTTRSPMMTPSYASPEQIRGEAVTTASDVFSLGVLLYELLAGRLPYQADDTAPLEVAREVIEVEPPPPSVASRGVGGAGEARARRLAGDLDAVVLQAIRKDPARRYATVAALADDLRRHLEGLPVTARPDGLLYRAGKLIRRHRLGVGAAAAALALLFTFAVVSAIQAGRLAQALEVAKSERARAEAQRREAEVAKSTAERVVGLLVGLFEVSDPTLLGERELSARDALDRGAARIRQELAGEPEVRAAIQAAMGAVYANLGRYDQAAELLAESLELRQAVGGDGDRELAGTALLLGEVHRHRADYPAAREQLDRAIEIYRARGARADLAQALDELGVVHFYAGDYEAAERPLREGLAMRRELFGDEAAAVASSLNNLGILLAWTSRLEEAETLYRQSIAISAERLGEGHPELLTRRMNLGGLLVDLGRAEEAEELLAGVASGRRAIYGADHPEVAIALANHAFALSDLGRYDQSERLLREALAIDRAALGDEHPEVASRLNNLAFVVSRRGDAEAAAELYARALAMREKVLGPGHPSTAITAFNLAAALRKAGDLAGAEEGFRRSAERLAASHGLEHATVAAALASLAQIQLERGRPAEAIPHLRRALAIQEKTLPADHWRAAVTRTTLGECLLVTGQPEAAEPLLEAAVAALEGTQGRPAEHLPAALAGLAAVYEATGRRQEALGLRQRRND